jgi:hypothetical protein
MTLKLTLKKMPFEVMVTGEKKIEFRCPSKWIESRLFDKENSKRNYKFIEFTNGYGKSRPFFKAKYNGFYVSNNVNELFSNGLEIISNEKTYCIKIGDIIEIKNYDSL